MANLAIRGHVTRGKEVIELGINVKELKEILDKYPPQAHVRIFGRCINVNDIAFEMPSINDHSKKIVQCCELQPSKRSNSGYKTIKVTDKACVSYKKEQY